MSVCQLVFDHIISEQVPKEDSTFPNLIFIHTQDGNLWAVDLYHDFLEVVAMFKYDGPHLNNIKNI